MWMRKKALATSIKMKLGQTRLRDTGDLSKPERGETFLLGPQREASLGVLFLVLNLQRQR